MIKLRVKRRTGNPDGQTQYATGDVYNGRRLSGYSFISEWQRKVDSGELKSATVHVFNRTGTSIVFYWEPERGFFNPRSNASGHDINELISRFISGKRAE